MSIKTTIITLIVIALVIVGFYMLPKSNVEEATMQDKVMTDTDKEMMMEDKGEMKMETGEDSMMKSSGSYETYSPEKLSLAESGKVVLFFRASWCPSCKIADADIRANLSSIPKGVTILDVDYDKYADLKKKYGVTYQHTFVQVDSSGNQIAKWAGSLTLSDLLAEIK